MNKREVERRNAEWNNDVDLMDLSEEVKRQCKEFPPYAVYIIKETRQNVFIQRHYTNNAGKLEFVVIAPPHINTHLHPSASGHGVFGLKPKDLEKSELNYWDVPNPHN